jgi:iron complex transport system permease protein
MLKYLGLGAAFCLLCLASLLLGAQQFSFSQLWQSDPVAWLTLTTSRLPRLMALLLTGAALAVCGVLMQQILQNRFADPGTTGAIDAAKLGILLAMVLFPAASVMVSMLVALLCCLVSCLFFILLINKLQLRHRQLLPILGLMYGSVLSAVAELYAYQQQLLQSMQGWLLGDFSKVIAGHYELIYLILPLVLCSYWFAHHFTLLGMGQQLAGSLGLRYQQLVWLGLVLVAAMVASSLITVGAIPFVGLVIPQLVAKHCGDHLAQSLPKIALAGAAFLISCDLLSRLLLYPYEIPIGLTASCVGALLLLHFLRTSA